MNNLKTLMLCSLFCLGIAADDVTKYVFDQTKKGILPEQEWNRELNVKNPSAIGIIIDCENPIVVTLGKDSAIQKLKAGQQIAKDDEVFTEDVAKPPYRKEINVVAGKYWFIIMNNGKTTADITMKWYEPTP